MTVEELFQEHAENCARRAFDRVIERNSGVGLLRCVPGAYKRYLKEISPSAYALHNAAWRAGYAVNGVDP